MDTRFQANFSMICAGPTGSGKTQWVRSFIQHSKHIMNPPPDRVIWCYGQYQDCYSRQDLGIPVEYVEGVPDMLFEEIDSSITNLIVLDDLMCELSNDKRMTKLVTKYS